MFYIAGVISWIIEGTGSAWSAIAIALKKKRPMSMRTTSYGGGLGSVCFKRTDHIDVIITLHDPLPSAIHQECALQKGDFKCFSQLQLYGIREEDFKKFLVSLHCPAACYSFWKCGLSYMFNSLSNEYIL